MAVKFKNPMLGKISNLLAKNPLEGVSDEFDTAELATAALLMEAAAVDGNIDNLEKDRVAMLLSKKFSISTSKSLELIMATARVMRSVPDFRSYTRQINKESSLEDKLEIMDMLWQITYADGEAHDFEIKIVYQVADMLHISEEQNNVAWKNAMDKLLNGPVPPSVSLPSELPENRLENEKPKQVSD